MDSALQDVIRSVSFGLFSDWVTTLSLVFGGCCSNALTLEQVISEHPNAGTLITFIQFVLISLVGLKSFVVWTPYPHLKPRQIPLLPYLLQVLLFSGLSLLNNAAFRYNIPMSVHIIFRSGGLVVSMLLGWLLLNRKYNVTQVASVLLVTAGVVLTTLSASGPRTGAGTAAKSSAVDKQEWHLEEYMTGISLLTLALFMGGLLGIVQDRTYERFVRRFPKQTGQNITVPWQESMFYLHFLSLPFFVFVWPDLAAELRSINTGPTYHLANVLSFPASLQLGANLQSSLEIARKMEVPKLYIPLLLNTITQLLCVAGVNRLTSRVSSLTVTLVLVVRKAVSLIISVFLFRAAGRAQMGDREKMLLYLGAFLVFFGTVGYSLGTQEKKRKETEAMEKSKQE